ncbi:5-oxoprolinase subunit PxpB [Marinagarivorans cellulosilyticus]|uniref:Carboxyltransferase domain-containing protein n=1 Tax=Marinagarivorans cellulosilyticus TaxID=2721545 RepID=A0AAN1WHF5_9GAMM|nr:5-oxoprolinase subunit PxpB [Marinagarivorans cellulosilyticus]BCD97657.1 hypothetical protein MARGE09_P1858 [Marinagarivorans cellulosilyticus]
MTAPKTNQTYAVYQQSLELVWHNENTVSVIFNVVPSIALTDVIGYAQQLISQQFAAAVIDTIPAYNGLMLVFDFSVESPELLAKAILDSLKNSALGSIEKASNDTDILTIPVCYHRDMAPDLPALASCAGLGIDEVIAVHSQATYTVCALGFAPGFPYLGFVDARIAKPRLATPRQNVAAGSIGIADNQTGVYPSASPGGWNIIGRTPLVCFDIQRPVSQASIFSVGQKVRFEPVSRSDYAALNNKFSRRGCA